MSLTRINNQALTDVTSAGLPSGTVLQVVNTSTSTLTATNTTNGVWGDIAGMTLTITPKRANSKLLITYTNHIYVQNVSGQTWTAVGIRLLRGSTVIQSDPNAGYGTAHNLSSNSDRTMQYQTNQFVDTPNTTSAVTYHLEAATTQGSTSHWLNFGTYGGGGEFVIIEIAG